MTFSCPRDFVGVEGVKGVKGVELLRSREANTFTCTFTGDDPHSEAQVRYAFMPRLCCKIMECISFDDLAVGG